jgi:hypothetical protein
MTTALEGVRGQRHAPAAIYPQERRGTHCTGVCVGPRAGLDRCGKSPLPPEFDPRTVHHLASRYTDYVTRPILCEHVTRCNFADVSDDHVVSLLCKTRAGHMSFHTEVKYMRFEAIRVIQDVTTCNLLDVCQCL